MGQHGEEIVTESLFLFNPQSLRDSPGGALGTEFPKPLASLRTACAIPFTPSPLRDSPGGALGTEFPKPLASLRSEFVVLHYY